MRKAQIAMETAAEICYSLADSLNESNNREYEEDKWLD